MEKFSIEDLIKNIQTQPKKRIDYSFQDLGLELQDWFPVKDKSRVWSIFYKVGYTEELIRYSFKECKKRNIKNINYMITIIKNKLSTSKINK